MSGLEVEPRPGWVADDVRAEHPELRAASSARGRPAERAARPRCDSACASSPTASGAPRPSPCAAAPVPWAYRVFFRHIGLDPDVTRTPIESAALERLIRGGWRSENLLDDALTIALIETGVPLWALDAGHVEGDARDPHHAARRAAGSRGGRAAAPARGATRRRRHAHAARRALRRPRERPRRGSRHDADAALHGLRGGGAAHSRRGGAVLLRGDPAWHVNKPNAARAAGRLRGRLRRWKWQHRRNRPAAGAHPDHPARRGRRGGCEAHPPRTRSRSLEAELSASFVAAYPRKGIEFQVSGRGGPRMLSLGDLERLRDDLAHRVQEARRTLDDRVEVEGALPAADRGDAARPRPLQVGQGLQRGHRRAGLPPLARPPPPRAHRHADGLVASQDQLRLPVSHRGAPSRLR